VCCRRALLRRRAAGSLVSTSKPRDGAGGEAGLSGDTGCCCGEDARRRDAGALDCPEAADKAGLGAEGARGARYRGRNDEEAAPDDGADPRAMLDVDEASPPGLGLGRPASLGLMNPSVASCVALVLGLPIAPPCAPPLLPDPLSEGISIRRVPLRAAASRDTF